MAVRVLPATDWRLGHRPGLDGLRGLAVLVVVACHLKVPLTGGGGTVGVTLFFVLSGFLITSLLIEELRTTGTVSLTAFYRRRALRLLPALFTLAAFLVLYGAVTGALEFYALRAVAAVTYIANLVPDRPALQPVWHTWTLATEEQFYLIWPPILVALAFKPRWWTILFALAVAAAALLLRWEETLPIVVGATMGAIFAWRPIRPTVAMTVAALVVMAIGVIQPRPLHGWSLALAIIPSIVLVAHEATSERRSVLRWMPLRGAGRISYGWYLWHPVVIWLLLPVMGGSILPQRILVMGGIGLIAALLSYHFVEQPFLRMKRRRSVRGHANEKIGIHAPDSQPGEPGAAVRGIDPAIVP